MNYGEFLQLLSDQFNWPIAFTVIASVVTIVTGVVTYLLKIRVTPQQESVSKDIHDLEEKVAELKKNYEKLHTRISDNRNKSDDVDVEIRKIISNLEADVRIIFHTLESLQQNHTALESHLREEMRTVNDKINKVMDIMLRMLSDDVV